MGHATLFSHALRILTCASCGAPIDISEEGGNFKCQFCQAVNHLGPRAATGRAPVSQTTVSESERLARLRQQDRHPAPPPPAVATLFVRGGLPVSRVPQAEAMWLESRREFAESASFHAAERLFHLTVALAPHLEDRAQRAKLETAIEVLTDEGHRHVLQCMLARIAAQHSDVEAAELWLEPVDPRPLDLQMDTAYRHAAAMVATVRTDFRQVTQLLGSHGGDVPFADGDEFGCHLLRINALEQGGRQDAALREMSELIQVHGAPVVQAARERYLPVGVCVQSFRAAKEAADAASQADAELLRAREKAQQEANKDAHRKKVHGALLKAEQPFFHIGKVLGFLIWTSIFSCVITAPWTCVTVGAMDADPLFGAHAKLLCPQICADCEAPYRMASWSTTTNGNSTSSHGAVYCNDSVGRVGVLDDSGVWQAAVSEESSIAENKVPTGGFLIWGTMLVGLLPLAALLTVLLMILGYTSRLKKRRELRAELASLPN